MPRCAAVDEKGRPCEHNDTHNDGYFDYHKTTVDGVHERGWPCKVVLQWKDREVMRYEQRLERAVDAVMEALMQEGYSAHSIAKAVLHKMDTIPETVR